jgi:glutamine amidotransferase
VHSSELGERSAVVVASEPMDEDLAWRLLASGELLHVDRDLGVSSTVVIDHPPLRLLSLADLGVQGTASQGAAVGPHRPQR